MLNIGVLLSQFDLRIILQIVSQNNRYVSVHSVGKFRTYSCIEFSDSQKYNFHILQFWRFLPYFGLL